MPDLLGELDTDRATSDADTIASYRALVKQLERDNADLRARVGVVDGFHAAAPIPPKWAARKKPKAGAATVVAPWSDLHFDEVVNPAELHGHNAYNREIAEMRLRRLADKTCEMGERFPHQWDGAVVPVIGDLFSGLLHDLPEHNVTTMPATLVHWVPQLVTALRRVVDFYGRLHVPWVVGNHGRLTHKPRTKKRAIDNFDWLAGNLVASYFQADDRVTFDIPQGPDAVTPVYGTTFVFTHGDRVSGGGGIGGIWPPMMRMVAKTRAMYAAQGIACDVVVMGHWHQYVPASTQGFVVNGSLVGWSEYCATMGFAPEPPQQAWMVVTPEHGVTGHMPLLVSDRKQEGW